MKKKAVKNVIKSKLSVSRDGKAKVIAVGNQKGGVGKTTNTVHIARALVELGRKVLIVDLDMNHGATRHFGIEPEAFLGSFEMLIGAEAAENLVLTGADKDEGVNLPRGLDLPRG